MSIPKKYYWLKLKENFFEEDTIAWLEEQENGKDYCLFYLKLCLKSLGTNGFLIRTVGEFLMPYDEKTLSKLTNTDTDTVIVSMELFKKIGLIEILESGEIHLKQMKELIGKDTDKAKMMRRVRAKEKKKGNIVTQTLPKRYPNVTQTGNNVTQMLPYIEKEIELEKDIDIELDKEKESTLSIEIDTSVPFADIQVQWNNIESLNKIKLITEKRKKNLKARIEEHNIESIFEVMNSINKSKFLKGANDKNWKVTFDWVFGSPNNFVKILEGNYKSKTNEPDWYDEHKKEVTAAGQNKAEEKVDMEELKEQLDNL